MGLKWFQLVDAAGATLADVDGVSVDLPLAAGLRKAVQTEYADSLLAVVAASELVVYANRMAFDAKLTPLEVDHPIDSLGESDEDPLIVQVPPVRPPGSPPFAHLNDVESLTRECGSLTTWEVGAVYDIPMICELMKPVGGCTKNGKIFWRQEEQQLVALLLSGWLPESYPHSIKNLAAKKSIVFGSKGVGKSTLLCLLAFFTVLKHKKNVLLYRRLLEKGSESALLYLGWEQDRVVFFSLSDCSDAWAAKMYESMWDSVELWLDGFVYKEVPNGLGGFAILTTSQGVDLKSQAGEHAYMCLFPSWRQKDLFALGRAVFHFGDDEMENRFYYSGGSVGDFSAPTVQNIEDAISAAVRSVKDPKDVLATAPFAFVTSDQANRIQHTFLKDVEEGAEPTSRFIRCKYWEQVVDSEHAVSLLNVGMQADALYRIFEWVQHAGYASLAATAFELYTHRVAATYRLKLFVSEYNPDSSSKEEPRYPGHFRELTVEKGRTQCSGTKHEFIDALTTWRDTEEMTYWYPDDWGFGSIDSIAKLAPEDTTEKRRIACLRITLATELSIDSQQLKSVNEIFKVRVPPVARKCESGQDIEADGSEVTTGTAAAAAVENEVLNEIDPNGSAPRDMSSEAAPEAEPPIYIAICPDKAACERLTLTPSSQVLAAGRECKLYVGYYEHATYASTLRFFGFV